MSRSAGNRELSLFVWFDGCVNKHAASLADVGPKVFDGSTPCKVVNNPSKVMDGSLRGTWGG